MIITKVRLQEEHPMKGATGVEYALPVLDLDVNPYAGENGYILKVAEGLGPPDFLAVAEGYDANGVTVMTSIPQTRDIGFRIALNPQLGQSYGQLRDDLYKLISRTVFVKLMQGAEVIAQAVGFIKQFDSTAFLNVPEVQMIVECQDGAFSAPYAVPIPLEEINTATPVINYIEGSAPTGMDLVWTVKAPAEMSPEEAAVGAVVNSFSITEYSKFWAVGGQDVHNVFTVNYPLMVNDQVALSTYPKKRRITVLRSGTTYDLAGYLNAGAVWPKLFTGVNAFNWTLNPTWVTWVSATYIPRFWGV